MDWDDLHTFLAIARHGSLSAAARALGVTQPTMGRRLAAMEQRTGARLLQKLPGGYALTPLGESILGNAERAENEVMAADRIITGRDVTLEGVVRLTTVDTLASRIVTPALVGLQKTHPGIVVELVTDTRSLSLSKREADIALRMTRFEGHDIVARKVGSLVFGLYGTAHWKATAPDQVRLVTVLDDQAHLPEAKWLAEQFPKARPAYRTNSREAQLWATKTGAGVAALARFRARMEPDLVEIGPAHLSRDIWLGVHSDMRLMPRVRVVLDALAQALQMLD